MSKHTPEIEGGVELAGAQLGMRAQTVQLKTVCAMKLNDYLDQLGWTQERIGRELGLSQPHVSELRNYALDRFSVDRILGFMAAMGLRINIQIDVPQVSVPEAERNAAAGRGRRTEKKVA